MGSQVPEIEAARAGQVVETVGRLRGLELRKSPSIAETIESRVNKVYQVYGRDL